MPHAQCHQGDLQGIGAIGAADAVFGAAISGQLSLQLGHFRAEDVVAVCQYGLDIGIDLAFNARLLRGKVDKIKHFSIHFSAF